jgi:hypothetical protein
VYFFVPAGSTAAWPQVPVCGALSVATKLDLPPAGRQKPPGTYWLMPLRRGSIRLTDGDALLAVLTEVIPEWSKAAS